MVALYGCGTQTKTIIFPTTEGYTSIPMSGFTIKIKTDLKDTPDAVAALEHMAASLEEIAQRIDPEIVDDLRSSVIWMELDAVPEGAAHYHPSVEWLIENGFSEEKAKCVEICNYINFVDWSKRNQPYMVLHELTHLYHNKILGDDHQGILDAYAAAKESGVYHNCEYRRGPGLHSIREVAYAMNNEKEYFAEITEAYFGENDYFPFNYYDLKERDPKGFELVQSIWGVIPEPGIEYSHGVTAPPKEIVDEYNLNIFYRKYIDANGIPVISSKDVSCEALAKAAKYASLMLEKSPKAIAKMQESKTRLGVMGKDEQACDLPEHRDLMTAFPQTNWNTRGRGYGATKERPLVSCAEENVLNLEGDRYEGEDIMIHEFAHAVHIMGLMEAYPEFQPRLEKLYAKAVASGKWENTYAITNLYEYLAEGVQSFYNVNRESKDGKTDGQHNHVNTREELKEFDIELHDLIADYFTDKYIASI